MTRHGSANRRPNFDVLERRALLAGQWTVGLPTAIGLGATGKYSAIHSNAVATDTAGDTVITGSFRGSVGFDPNSSGSTLATNNTQDTFVAKYSPSGSLLWVRSFVGQATQVTGQPTTYAVAQGSALAVDGSGNILVAGSFSGTVAFGAGTNPTTLASPNGTEAFTAKLDGSGNLVWASNAVAAGGDDSASAVVADGSGGAIIAGSYAHGVSLGGTTLGATGASEAFIAHLDTGGKFTWAVGTQGSAGSNAGAKGLARDGAGNVVVAGFIAGTVALGAGTRVIGAGSDDAAVWKLDATGHPLWARSWGSPDYDAANSVAVDPAGNILTTGAFSDTVNFATGLSSATLTAGASFDAFVVKLDTSGNELWVRGFVGPDGWAVGSGIAIDASGNSHVAGSFRGTVDFDPGPGVANLVSVGYTDLFVAGLDPSGNQLYAIHAGQTNSNEALGIAATTVPGTVAITGTYSGAIAFGTTTLPTTATTAIFAARVVAQSPPPATLAAPVPEPASITGTNNTTSITSPIFDETGADPADSVRLLRDGVVVGQRLGPGAITDPGPVSQGTHAYTAIQISPSGTASLASPATTITVLTTPPPAPGALVLVAADDSGTVGDGITNVRQPRLSGHAAAGTNVQVVNSAGVVVGSTTAGTDGSFTAKLNSSLVDGSYSLQARSIDLASNLSPLGPKLGLVILATPTNLAAPTLAAADDTGVAGDGMTTVRRPRIAGSGTPGGRIDWLGADGSVLASTTAVATGGAYILQAPAAFANGVIGVRVRETDVAGNVGAISPTLNLTVRAAPGRLLRRLEDGYRHLPPERQHVLHPETHDRPVLRPELGDRGRRAGFRRLLRRRSWRRRGLSTQRFDLLRPRPRDQRRGRDPVGRARLDPGSRRLRRRRQDRCRDLLAGDLVVLRPGFHDEHDGHASVRDQWRHPGPGRLLRRRPHRFRRLPAQHRHILHSRPSDQRLQGRHPGSAGRRSGPGRL